MLGRNRMRLRHVHAIKLLACRDCTWRWLHIHEHDKLYELRRMQADVQISN